MRSIKIASLAIVAVLAFSAIAVADASAEEFIASTTGKLKGKATNNQEFKTGTGATLVCTTATPEGTVNKLKGSEMTLTETWGGCTVSGIGTATVTDYLLSLFTPLEISYLAKPIKINSKALGVECEIEIGLQKLVTGHSMTELSYVNKAPGIEITSAITKIASEIKKSNSTGLCGTVGEKKEGTYQGKVQVEIEGGTMEVK